MAHNLKRAARMKQHSTAQLLVFYKAKTLSSAAAAYELQQRNVALPKREGDEQG